MTKQGVPFENGSMGSHILSDMIQGINLMVKPENTPTLTAAPHSPLVLKTACSNGNGKSAAKSAVEEPNEDSKESVVASDQIDPFFEDHFRQV